MAEEEQFYRLYRWKSDQELADALIERKTSHAEDAAIEIHLNGWRRSAEGIEHTKEQLEAEIDEVVKKARNANDLDGVLIHLVRRMLRNQISESI